MKDYSQENSMVCGAQYEESTERPEPEFERHEPEDAFPVSVRLSMMINQIPLIGGYDQRQLIQLLKDAKQEIDAYSKLADSIIKTTDKVKETEASIRSKLYQGGQV